MTTKEQERAALEKIRKILEGLGEESYVGHAFKGVVEVAEGNIDNDFWNNPVEANKNLHDRLDQSKRVCEQVRKELNEKKDELDKAVQDREYFRAEASRQSEYTESAERERDAALHELNDTKKKLAESEDNRIKLWNQFRAMEDHADAMENEVIHLKAKLYDMMVAEHK